MKKKDIRPALDALKPIKLQKIEDKALRGRIIKTHVALVAAKNQLEEDQKALEEAHLGAYEKEREEVAQLQQDLQAESDPKLQKEILGKINGHKELFGAIREYNKAYEKFLSEDVPDIPLLKQKEFIDSIVEKQDLDLGAIEALYPLFG